MSAPKAKEKVVKGYDLKQRNLNTEILAYDDEHTKKVGLELKKRGRGRPKKYQ